MAGPSYHRHYLPKPKKTMHNRPPHRTRVNQTQPAGPHTLSQAKSYLSAANKSLRKARKQAVAARTAFLGELKMRIASRKTSSKLGPDAAIKMIDQQLKSAAGFRRIRHALKKDCFDPLTKVTVTRTRNTSIQ